MCEKNPPKAIEWLKKGLDYPPLMAIYSRCLQEGKGVEKNLELSKEWGQKAYESGHVYAKGYCCHFGLHKEKDYAEAVKHYQGEKKTIISIFYRLLLEAVDNGFALAAINLGVCCQNGLGVEKDWERAFR